MFDDGIEIILSPSLMQELMAIFKEKALRESNYDTQGLYRAKADFFESAFDAWRVMRDAKDKEPRRPTTKRSDSRTP